MLGRLLKYDLRSMSKHFSALWLTVPLVALANRLLTELAVLARLSEMFSRIPLHLDNVLSFLLGMSYFALMVALVVVSFIYVVQRFYIGLLGDEGYLMHTLPVKTWELIASKLLVATVVTLVSGLVGMLSVLLLSADMEGFRDLYRGLAGLHSGLGLLCLHLLLTVVFGLWSVYTQIYAACAVGQLSHKNRLVVSVVAFVALNIVWSTVGFGLMAIVSLLGIETAPLWVEKALMSIQSGSLSVELVGHMGIAVINILALVKTAVFFFVTEYLLRKKLNLQ